MLKELRLIAVLVVIFTCFACKREFEREVYKVPKDTIMAVKGDNYIVFEPEEKSASKEGFVVFGTDTLEVVSEFTDNVAFNQVVGSYDEGIMKYREKIVHLINKRQGDTITLKKQMFKNDFPDEFDKMVLQSVHFNDELKDRIVPLVITFCVPDSDYCFYYAVDVKEGVVNMEMFDEESYADNEE